MDRFKQKLFTLFPPRPSTAKPIYRNKVFGYFDKAYYINLDYREDRKKETEVQLSKHFVNAERFEARRPTDKGRYKTIGDRGCAESHFSIIKIAKEKKFKNVLILEDDIVFHKDFNKYIDQIIKRLKILEWDMFYFSLSQELDVRTVFDDYFPIVSLKGSFCTHAYAINSRIYDVILDMEPTCTLPVDNLYRYKIHNQDRYRIYGVRGAIYQSSSPSDVTYINGPPSSHKNVKPRVIQPKDVEVVDQYIGLQSNWCNNFIINKDGTFNGGPHNPHGMWDYNDNKLILNWYHWDQEVLEKFDFGFIKKTKKDLLLLSKSKMLSRPINNIYGVYIAVFRNWQGALILSNDQVLYGGPKNPNGIWEIENDNLILKWFDWPTIKLKRLSGGFSNVDSTMIKYDIPGVVPTFRMPWNNPGFGDVVCLINMLSDIKNKYNTKVAYVVPNKSYMKNLQELIKIFNTDVTLISEDTSALLIHGDALYTYPQRILKNMWVPGDYKRVCYQLDGRYEAARKNPPKADIDKLTSFLPDYEFVKIGGRDTIKEELDVIKRCDLFIGVDSGMAHLCLSTGIPVFVIEYGMSLYAFQNSLIHHCKGTDDCIKKVKNYIDKGLHKINFNESVINKLPYNKKKLDSFQNMIDNIYG